MVSHRIRQMSSFIVMDVLERANEIARQGHNVIHLEVGEPDFNTPECVKRAVCRALDSTIVSPSFESLKEVCNPCPVPSA